MTLSVVHIVFDCADAEKLASFWAAALRRDVDPEANAFFATVGRPDPGQVTLMFLQVPEGKQGKNRMHLDLAGDDWETELVRLTELGAVRVGEFHEYGMRWFTLRDPEGNEFDLGAGTDAPAQA